MKRSVREKKGITLVELMVTILISTIVMAGIGITMVDSQRAFAQMYERTEGDVVNDTYVARGVFDRICRKASVRRCAPAIGALGSFAEVYYYNDVNSPSPDRYANFRVSNGTLLVDNGIYVESTKSKTLTSTETLAKNVTATQFAVRGSTVIMTLTLQKNGHSATVSCSAVRYNE